METKREEKKADTIPGLATVDNLGRRFVRPDRPRRVKDPDDGFIITYGVRPMKDDPTRTETYVEKRESIHKLVQVNADKVGIKAMLKAVALGEITAASLADDGKGGVDDRAFSGYVPPLSALAKQSEEVIEKAKESYPGLTAENFEQLINDAVNKRIAEIEAQKAAKKEGE